MGHLIPPVVDQLQKIIGIWLSLQNAGNIYDEIFLVGNQFFESCFDYGRSIRLGMIHWQRFATLTCVFRVFDFNHSVLPGHVETCAFSLDNHSFWKML